jgi:hypothetical protein
MERSVGRQPAHYDNDRREQGRKLYIPRRVHAGDIEQSDGDKSYLRRQWDYRHYGQNRQHDSICNVTQSAGRRDSSTDEALELSRKSAADVRRRPAFRRASVTSLLIRPFAFSSPPGFEHGRDRLRDRGDVTVGRPAQVVRSADGLRRELGSGDDQECVGAATFKRDDLRIHRRRFRQIYRRAAPSRGRGAWPKTSASAVIGIDARSWKTSAGLSRRGRPRRRPPDHAPLTDASSSRSRLAATRSALSNPSVNFAYTELRRAAVELPRAGSRVNRERLMAVRSSHAGACCRRAKANDCPNNFSASPPAVAPPDCETSPPFTRRSSGTYQYSSLRLDRASASSIATSP